MLKGLYDRRLGTASAKRVPTDEIARVLTLYRERYRGFTVKHFHEHLVQEHGFRYGYTWTKLTLPRARLVKKAPRRSAHREASGRGVRWSAWLAAPRRLVAPQDPGP